MRCCHRSRGRRRQTTPAHRKCALEPLFDPPHFAALDLRAVCLAVPSYRWAICSCCRCGSCCRCMWPTTGVPAPAVPGAGGVQHSGGPVENYDLRRAQRGVQPPPDIEPDARLPLCRSGCLSDTHLSPRRHLLQPPVRRRRRRLDSPGAQGRGNTRSTALNGLGGAFYDFYVLFGAIITEPRCIFGITVSPPSV